MRKLAGTLTVVLLALGAIVLGARQCDGPLGPIPGGSLRSGDLVSDRDVDWSSITREAFVRGIGLVELELVEPPGSRTIVAIVHDGQLYGVCDLGFSWRRIEPAPRRWGRALLYSLRTWHEHALRDGRAVVRVGGKRYLRQAVRATDPEVLEALRSLIQATLKQRGGERISRDPVDPEAIWFFRMDPRPAPSTP
jgi:hypothetical protein